MLQSHAIRIIINKSFQLKSGHERPSQVVLTILNSGYTTQFSTKMEKCLCILVIHVLYKRTSFWSLKRQTFENVFFFLQHFFKLLPLCKLWKCKFVKTVTSCSCILCVHSIDMHTFLYKVTLPTTDLACIVQHLKQNKNCWSVWLVGHFDNAVISMWNLSKMWRKTFPFCGTLFLSEIISIPEWRNIGEKLIHPCKKISSSEFSIRGKKKKIWHKNLKQHNCFQHWW